MLDLFELLELLLLDFELVVELDIEFVVESDFEFVVKLVFEMILIPLELDTHSVDILNLTFFYFFFFIFFLIFILFFISSFETLCFFNLK